jgi:hypothetical protein
MAAFLNMIVSDAEEIARLRVALRPLANVAVAIDENVSCVEHKRQDNTTIWQPNVWERGPFDLTMGHARAARRLLDSVKLDELEDAEAPDLWRLPVEEIPSGWRLSDLQFALGRATAIVRQNSDNKMIRSSGNHRSPAAAIRDALGKISE